MYEFKIGDRVIVSDSKLYSFLDGKSGNIVYIKKGSRFTQDQCAVEFDQQISGGHSCRGHAKTGRGKWVMSGALQPSSVSINPPCVSKLL